MALRESVKSVRILFTLWGLFGVLGVVKALIADAEAGFSRPEGRLNSIETLTFDTGVLCFMLATLYAGVFLPRLLRNSAGGVLMLLRINIALSALAFVVGLVQGHTLVAVISFAVALLMLLYLMKSVRRLAAEARPASQIQPIESTGT